MANPNYLKHQIIGTAAIGLFALGILTSCGSPVSATPARPVPTATFLPPGSPRRLTTPVSTPHSLETSPQLYDQAILAVNTTPEVEEAILNTDLNPSPVEISRQVNEFATFAKALPEQERDKRLVQLQGGSNTVFIGLLPAEGKKVVPASVTINGIDKTFLRVIPDNQSPHLSDVNVVKFLQNLSILVDQYKIQNPTSSLAIQTNRDAFLMIYPLGSDQHLVDRSYTYIFDGGKTGIISPFNTTFYAPLAGSQRTVTFAQAVHEFTSFNPSSNPQALIYLGAGPFIELTQSLTGGTHIEQADQENGANSVGFVAYFASKKAKYKAYSDFIDLTNGAKTLISITKLTKFPEPFYDSLVPTIEPFVLR